MKESSQHLCPYLSSTAYFLVPTGPDFSALERMSEGTTPLPGKQALLFLWQPQRES